VRARSNAEVPPPADTIETRISYDLVIAPSHMVAAGLGHQGRARCVPDAPGRQAGRESARISLRVNGMGLFSPEATARLAA
jgi:hypothetical protein